jgi:hypothetical protein
VFAAVVISFILVLFLLRSGGSAAGFVAVLVYFVQTAALEVRSVSQWLTWLHAVNFRASSMSACLARWTPYEQVLASLLVPLFLLVEVLLLALLHFGLYRFFQRRSPDAAVGGSLDLNLLERSSGTLSKLVANFDWDSYLGVATSVLLFCYTQVAITSFTFLYCVDVGPNRVLFTSPTMNCRSSMYRTYLVPVILMIALYVVGFPCAMVVLLWRSRSMLSHSGSLSDDGTHTASTASSSFFRRWGPAYVMYRAAAWFWQPVVLVRRACFVLASVLLIEQPSIQFMTFGFLNFASLMMHLMVRPFHESTINYAETISNMMLVCVSGLLTGYMPPYATFVQVLTFLLVVPLAAVLAVLTLRQQWLELLHRFRQRKKTRVGMRTVGKVGLPGDLAYPLSHPFLTISRDVDSDSRLQLADRSQFLMSRDPDK